MEHDIQYQQCDRRITTLEEDVCNITKPETGALSRMHEKINGGFSETHSRINDRPTWIVFWSIVGLLFTLITGAYLYSKSIGDDQQRLLTKEDFREFKQEILSEIRRSRP